MLKIIFTTARTVLSLLVGVLVVVSCQSPFSVGAPTPKPSHLITSSTLGWHEIWRRTLWLSYGSGTPMASIIGDKIVVPAWNEHETDLTALNSQSGQVLWGTKLASPDQPDGQVVHSLFADTEQVYVVLPFVVESFRTTDGYPLWTSETLPGHTGYSILPSVHNGAIQVIGGYGAEGALVYNVDPGSGAIKSTETYPIWLAPKTDAVSYYVDSASNLICIDNRTNQTLWKINTGGLNGGLELVDSKALIFMDGPHLKSLTAVDPVSGKTLWHTTEKNIASNFIVISNIVYSITSNATIVANDAFTGREVGQMAFSGGILDTDHASEYWLLAGDSKLFVYFGDSQELIAFNPE